MCFYEYFLDKCYVFDLLLIINLLNVYVNIFSLL